MAEMYDAVIVGAGPAGATSAALLASKGHRVVLVDQSKFPRKTRCAGWISGGAKRLLAELKIGLQDVDAHAFTDVSFHTPDFTKSAKPSFQGPAGYLISRSVFDERLAAVAADYGVTFMDRTCVRSVNLGERSVSLECDGSEVVQGRLLVLAAGSGTALVEQLRLGPGAMPAGWQAAHIETEKIAARKKPKVIVVLGLDQAGGVGLIIRDRARVSVAVLTPAETGSVISTMTALCKTAAEHGILDVDLSRQAARSRVIMTPAAVAVATDTHVAKRTLIIGDAGGFVSATSGEGIYPAMWSAHIAAGVIHDALGSESPQDVLIEFNTRWRTEMAEYLRPPNTDTQYILPLVFSNQPMADRMGAAFFSGENI